MPDDLKTRLKIAKSKYKNNNKLDVTILHENIIS